MADLKYGYGYRQPLDPEDEAIENQPSLQVLRDVLAAQGYRKYSSGIRANQQPLNSTWGVIGTAIDSVRANVADRKAEAAELAAAEQAERERLAAQQEQEARDLEERRRKADAVYKAILAQNGNQQLAEGLADMVFNGMEIPAELLKQPAKPEPSSQEQEYQNLVKIYGVDEAKKMFGGKYEDPPPAPPGPTADESEYAQLERLYGPEQAKLMWATKYKAAPTGPETKAFADMPGESRVKLGLIANSGNLLKNALPDMFDDEGNYRNWAGVEPKTATSISRDDLRESLRSTLRAVTGATIGEEEIDAEVDGMMPGFFDSDEQAQRKILRAVSKLRSLHAGLTGGFVDVPGELSLPGFEQPWLMTDEQRALREEYGAN